MNTTQTARLRENSKRRKAGDTTKTESSPAPDAAELGSPNQNETRENPYPGFNDVLIWTAIRFENIYVDAIHGRIFNRNGKEISQWKASGYMMIDLPGFEGKVPVLVHRVVYISAHLNDPLPFGYDIHHIDKNPENNSLLNLEAMPMEIHTKNEILQKLSRYGGKYARLTGTEWNRCSVTKDLVLALRVCIKYGSYSNTRKKGTVYRYFREKMRICPDYASKIAAGIRGNLFAGKPTAEETKHYLKEYAWLLTAVKNGDTYEQIQQRYPEKFDENQATETNQTA